MKIATIGPETSRTLATLGLKPAVEAREHTIDGLIEALLAAAKPSVWGDGRARVGREGQCARARRRVPWGRLIPRVVTFSGLAAPAARGRRPWETAARNEQARAGSWPGAPLGRAGPHRRAVDVGARVGAGAELQVQSGYTRTDNPMNEFRSTRR